MQLLILGGTGWLGAEIACQAVAAGHDVTCLARRDTVPDGATSVVADRDAVTALTGVARRRWDAVIDLAMQPGHVRRAARDLGPVAARYLLVSTCSVYASLAAPGIDEEAATVSPIVADHFENLVNYAGAKVACEQAVHAVFGEDRSLVLRPGLIGGPGDESSRTTYWPHRFARPAVDDASVLVPDAPRVATSVIDVRDLAAFALSLVAAEAHGTFNVTGAATALGKHLDLARATAGHRGTLVPVAPAWLADNEVAQWAGPRSLPLWLDDESFAGMGLISSNRALSAGLARRPLSETLADALAWSLETNEEAAGVSGLTDDDERELLAAWAAR